MAGMQLVGDWNNKQLSFGTTDEWSTFKVVYNNNQTSSYDCTQNDYYIQLTADYPVTGEVKCSGSNYTYVVDVETWRAWNYSAIAADEAERRAIAADIARSDATAASQRFHEDQQQRKDAANRAEELLLMMLTPEQKSCYLKNGYFDTVVNNKIYRLNKDRKVQLINKQNGRPTTSYCIHVGQNAVSCVPRSDELLAFKLMLEAEEARFLRVANANHHMQV